MHIPDGYLSPATCGAFYLAMVPFWARATRRVRKLARSRHVPLLAVGAAFSFLVMMFNIPVPDGTTAHAVGAVLIAILLGPWAAVIAVSIALAIQALFFGDGGVLAFGANAFNMAVVMPFVGYGVYKLIANRTSLTSGRRVLAAGDRVASRCRRRCRTAGRTGAASNRSCCAGSAAATIAAATGSGRRMPGSTKTSRCPTARGSRGC